MPGPGGGGRAGGRRGRLPGRPETPFPGPLEDCLAVAEWLAEGGAELGVYGTRLAVVGGSSGANLAAALAALARDAGRPRIALQCLAYPATDPSPATASYAEYADDPFLSREEMVWHWDRHTAPEQRADVRNGDLGGLPPAIVITAGHDPLRDEGMAYAGALQAAGVPTALHHYPEDAARVPALRALPRP